MFDEGGGLDVFGAGEVREEALAQAFRLAYVYDFPAFVVHEVDTALKRGCAGLVSGAFAHCPCKSPVSNARHCADTGW